MTDHVQLGDDHERFVAAAVAEGQFESRDAVLREGVRLVRQRQARLEQIVGSDHDNALVARLRAGVARGIADADAGRTIQAEEGFARLRRYLKDLDADETS